MVGCASSTISTPVCHIISPILSHRMMLVAHSGPSVAIDTACSSSLVAMDAARQQLLQAGLCCEAALVGGVNMMLLPTSSMMFHKAGMLSPDGRCKASVYPRRNTPTWHKTLP